MNAQHDGEWGIETLCVHTGVAKDSTYNSMTTPIYPTSTFAFEAPGRTNGYDYSRTANARAEAWITADTIGVSAGIENTQNLLDDAAEAFNALARSSKNPR